MKGLFSTVHNNSIMLTTLICSLLRANFKFLLSVVLILASALSYSSPDKVKSDDFGKLSAKLSQAKTLESKYEQELKDTNGKILESVNGKMFLQQGGFFRSEVNFPYEQIILSKDGKLWIWDKDLDQVNINKIDEQDPSSPILFLMGDHDQLREYYSVERVLGKGKAEEIFVLKALDVSASFNSIKIVFESELIKNVLLNNMMNQELRIHFYDTKINNTFSKGVFDLEFGPDIEVIDNTEFE